MIKVFQSCLTPLSGINARILAGGGVLGAITMAEAAFAYGPKLV